MKFESMEILMQPFINGYITCMLWAETDLDTDQPLEDIIRISDISEEATMQIMFDCRTFLLKSYIVIIYLTSTTSINLDQMGHDFWLTRNEHGAGFWDGDYPEPFGNMLTELADDFGEQSPYIGDDGKLYF